jgi:hypothetical protein
MKIVASGCVAHNSYVHHTFICKLYVLNMRNFHQHAQISSIFTNSIHIRKLHQFSVSKGVAKMHKWSRSRDLNLVAKDSFDGDGGDQATSEEIMRMASIWGGCKPRELLF